MEWAKIVGSLVVLIIAVGGLILVWERLKAKELDFGPATVRVLGIVLFIPSITLLAIMGVLQTEALATLFGTVAGYALSKAEEREGPTPRA